MEYPWFATIFTALILYGAITLYFTKSGRDLWWEMLFYYPDLALWTPLGLFVCYLYYCSQTGGIHLQTAWGILGYLMIPSLFLWKCRKAYEKVGDKLTCWDAMAILFLWLPFDLHLVSRRPNAMRDALDWPIIALSGVIIGLVFWVGLRHLEGAKAEFRFSLRGLGLTLASLFCLSAIVVPLGQATGFLVPREFWKNSSLPEILWTHLVTWKFVIYFAKIFVTIALSEEFLFRGIIQNFLNNSLKDQTISWILASLLFGSAHLNNGATSLYPSGWNWEYALMASIAGLAYGWVFRRTSSLLYPMLLHALVDSIWHTLFK